MNRLERKLGYFFSDQRLLHQALTHPSAGGRFFQRLEFLGDRVLGIIMAHWLYGLFPLESEGSLSKRFSRMVCRQTLTQLATQLGLAQELTASDRVIAHQDTRVMADTCEAVIGAMYLDGGLEKAAGVVHTLWTPFLSKDVSPPVDAKSALQEYLQWKKKLLPSYLLLLQDGPSHCPLFQVQLIIDTDPPFIGTGKSKREAEQQAAQKALDFYNPPF